MLQLSPFAFYLILSRAQEWLVTIFLNKEDNLIKNTLQSLWCVCVCVCAYVCVHVYISVCFPWLINTKFFYFLQRFYFSNL